MSFPALISSASFSLAVVRLQAAPTRFSLYLALPWVAWAIAAREWTRRAWRKEAKVGGKKGLETNSRRINSSNSKLLTVARKNNSTSSDCSSVSISNNNGRSSCNNNNNSSSNNSNKQFQKQLQ